MSSTIQLIRRDDISYAMIFKDADGARVDITGATIWFTVKKKPQDSDADALIQETWSNHTDPTQGETTLSLTAAQTNVTPGIYKYDFQVVSSGAVTSTISGCCEILQDITQRVS